MRTKIPITKYTEEDEPWIDYQGRVLVIEVNEEGNLSRFQYQGVMCRQGYVNGYLFKEFTSKSKYFDSNFWYKATSWTTPDRIFFQTEEDFKYPSWGDEKGWDKIYKDAQEKGRPVDKILKAILKEVENKTGVQFELDFTDLNYTENWAESYIPLKYKDKKYLLTWENCD